MPAVDVDAFEFPRPPRPRANHLGGDLSIANAAKRGDWKFERRLVSALTFASVRVPVEEFEVGAQDGVIRAPESVEDDLVDVPLARLRFERLLGQIAIRTPRTFVLGPIRRWKRGHKRANGRGETGASRASHKLEREPRSDGVPDDDVRRVDEPRRDHGEKRVRGVLGGREERLAETRASTRKLHGETLGAIRAAPLE